MTRRRPRTPDPELPPDPAAGEGAPARGADPGTEPSTFNILFVCTGNTCRSPMAEAIAREELARRGWAHVRVASAGIAAGEGGAASREAVEVVRHHGLELAAHRSRRLTPGLVRWADLILAMGPSHLAALVHAGGGEKSALLGEFAGGSLRGGGVSDPFGGSVAVYEQTFRELRRLVASALDRLAPILHP